MRPIGGLEMQTKVYEFRTSANVKFNIIAPDNIEFPSMSIEHYSKMTRCGAGDGWGDKIVPESIWGIVVTLACFVHDFMWEISEATWKDFHHSNSVFMINIISIVQALSYNNKWNPLKALRMYRAATYFNAVDSAGQKVFWKIKGGEPS